MEVNKELLQNFVNMLDTLITMTRDKLIWQNLAMPLLGDDWREKFEQARSNPQFLGEGELLMANIRQMRDWMVTVLDQFQKGETIQLPTERIN